MKRCLFCITLFLWASVILGQSRDNPIKELILWHGGQKLRLTEIRKFYRVYTKGSMSILILNPGILHKFALSNEIKKTLETTSLPNLDKLNRQDHATLFYYFIVMDQNKAQCMQWVYENYACYTKNPMREDSNTSGLSNPIYIKNVNTLPVGKNGKSACFSYVGLSANHKPARQLTYKQCLKIKNTMDAPNI